jgi:hypothetical protein
MWNISINSRCTLEIKTTIAMVKAAFNMKTLFTNKLDLNLKKLVKCYTWDTSENRSEISGKF